MGVRQIVVSLARFSDKELMKRIIGIFFALCCLNGIWAQDLKSLFVAMPDSLSPLLTRVNRADFGDFLASNMKAEVKNRFGKTSEMTELTADYLYVRLTSASSLEMKLLPVNDSVKVICVVHTYKAPVADSEISFYATDWTKLPSKDFLKLPEESDFYSVPLTEAGKDSLASLRMFADICLIKAELSPEGPFLSFVYSTPDYLDAETAEKLKPYLLPRPLRYVWSSGKFMKEENAGAEPAE